MEIKQDNFWSQVLPDCAAGFVWGGEIEAKMGKNGWEKSLGNIFKKVEDDEFNVFLAKLVIKASGKGFVGVDLTERIEILKGMRE